VLPPLLLYAPNRTGALAIIPASTQPLPHTGPRLRPDATKVVIPQWDVHELHALGPPLAHFVVSALRPGAFETKRLQGPHLCPSRSPPTQHVLGLARFVWPFSAHRVLRSRLLLMPTSDICLNVK